MLTATIAGGLLLASLSCTTVPTPISALAGHGPAHLAIPVSADAAIPAPAPRAQGSDSWRGGVRGMIGYRELSDDFDPVDKHFQFGIESDFRPSGFPIGFELGAQYSFGWEEDFEGSGVDITAGVGELYLGPRLTLDFADDTIHPYLGAGGTFLWADVEFSTEIFGGTATISDDDTAFAGYAHAGVLFDVGDTIQLGVDARAVFGAEYDFDFAGLVDTLDGDYFQIALLVGTHW